MTVRSRLACAAALLSAMLLSTIFGHAADEPSQEDIRIARSLATMLQSARAVVSRHQQLINDPAIGDKGLTGEVVLEEAVANYRKEIGADPKTVDPASYEGRMLKAQMEAVVEVMDANQATINTKGLGFKGFIPATFARLVNEAFARRVDGEATIKATAPPELVRNRKARPDEWETAVIRDYLQKADWPKGQIYAGVDASSGEARARIMVPEYYGASCMSCHGGPKGELDISGYPKEGASEGDLGGAISIGLTPQ